jgi:hypothetical protein
VVVELFMLVQRWDLPWFETGLISFHPLIVTRDRFRGICQRTLQRSCESTCFKVFQWRYEQPIYNNAKYVPYKRPNAYPKIPPSWEYPNLPSQFPPQKPPIRIHARPLCTNSHASTVLRNRSTSSTVNPIQILVHATSTLAIKHLSFSVRFNSPARRKSHAHQIHECPGPQTLYSEGSRSSSAAHFRNEILCSGIVCVDPKSGIPGCWTVNNRVDGDNVTNTSE